MPVSILANLLIGGPPQPNILETSLARLSMTMKFSLMLTDLRSQRAFSVFATAMLLGFLSAPHAFGFAQDASDASAKTEKAKEKATPKADSEPKTTEKSSEEKKAKKTKSDEKKAAPTQPTKKKSDEQKKDEKKDEQKDAQKKSGKNQSKKKESAEKKPDEKTMPAEKKTDEESKPTAEPVPDPEWVAQGVWTLPPVDGPEAIDFSLVGEYVGELKSSDASSDDKDAKANKPVRLGVQIRALGKGEFQARAYHGGLPGQKGFQNEEPLVLIGHRNDQTLVLSGGPWAMFAGPEECKIIDVSGNTLAQLPKITRKSPTLGAEPPQGAMVLFNGTDTSAFTNARMTQEKLLAQGADIRFLLGDFDLHFEFRIPHMPTQRDQKRGNSGLYLQSRYECQVLDSFADANVFNGLGALYRFKAPRMNMAFPPLTWQTYDIRFTSARYAADGSKLRNAHVTSWVNGVMVQDDQELPGPTGAGQDESVTLLPTKIQNHNDPVRFRNIWVIDRGLTGGISFP